MLRAGTLLAQMSFLCIYFSLHLPYKTSEWIKGKTTGGCSGRLKITEVQAKVLTGIEKEIVGGLLSTPQGNSNISDTSDKLMCLLCCVGAGRLFCLAVGSPSVGFCGTCVTGGFWDVLSFTGRSTLAYRKSKTDKKGKKMTK